MKEILEYIQQYINDPASYQLNKVVVDDKIEQMIADYAANHPPDLDKVIELLDEVYPSLATNAELIEKGDNLRREMMDKVFSEDFQVEEVKVFEARINLFDKMLNFNNTVSKLIDNVSGREFAPKKGKGITEPSGEQGTAQLMLKNNGKTKQANNERN